MKYETVQLPHSTVSVRIIARRGDGDLVHTARNHAIKTKTTAARQSNFCR